MTDPSEVTVLLRRLREGDGNAAEEMVPFVYEDLRGLARHLLAGDRANHTLQPTALVHEAWLKIQSALDGGSELQDRRHFFAVASRAMRQVLVNHARDRRTQKRGGDQRRLPLDDCLDSIEAQTGDLTEVSELLDQLAAVHARPARIVEMRIFGGMTIDEIAGVLGAEPDAVTADWRFARAWLGKRLTHRDQ
ncbi:MAG: RNA polymerase subunit sigma-70 [Planctomycetes bacterium]|nr:RNA polymerase subunit sigma-70 [Planctomycetota bacterium]